MDDEWHYIQTDTTQRHNLHPGSFFTLRPRFSMHKACEIELCGGKLPNEDMGIWPKKTLAQRWWNPEQELRLGPEYPAIQHFRAISE
jgi:hypothetical protein